MLSQKSRPGPVVLLLLAVALPARAGNIRITVLHTNDIHGWVMARPAAFYERDPRRPIGGAAALAAVVKRTQGPKLVLDAGDWFQGTPEGAFEQGRGLAAVFNAVGYDAMAAGNHDFDNGEKNLAAMIGAINAPVLCANVYRSDGSRPPEFKPWMVKEVAGVKVGIFAVLTTSMKELSLPKNIEGLTFRRAVAEANEDVAALRREGATVIIALSHLGLEKLTGPSFEGDQTLAARVEGIDLIVGGHTHTVLKAGLRDATYGTLIVQAGAELTRVGEIVLEIDAKTKKVVKSSARLVNLWPDETGSDPDAARAVDKLVGDVGCVYDTVVATAAATLTRNRNGESSLGDWMADCSRAWAGTDMAIQNSGGIRADLPVGPVTFRELFYVMPFENHIAKLVMNGKDLRSLLERWVGRGRLPQISGASLTVRRKVPFGQTLVSVTIAGKPIRDDASYTVSTIDFLEKGDDGYVDFEFAEKKEFTQTLMRDVLKRCAQKEALIETPHAGRLVFVGD